MATDLSNQEIKKRLSLAQSNRQVVQNTWDVIEKFVVPYRGEFFRDQTSENEIDWQNRDLYDSTAVRANGMLASSIHGAMTNPSYRWFELRFRDEELNKDTAAASWLEDTAQRMYYALQDSNFNLEIGEMYLDITSFGTSFPTLEHEKDDEGNTNLVFGTVPLKEGYFEEDHKGNVCNFYRKLSWTPIQMESKFGIENLPQSVKDCLEGDAATTKKDVIFCIYKRKLPQGAPTEAPLAPSMRPYGYKYILANDCELIGKVGGYYEMPTYVARWRRTSSSMWGNSPAMVALPDILTLNQLVQLILRSAEKVVDPANLTTERGLMSDLDLSPAGLTVVRDLENSLKPYESRARFDVSELQRDKLQASIREAFFVDELQLKDSPAMTATEVNVRYELMQRLIGPTAGRLQTDVFDNLLSRVFNIMFREGMLTEIPEVLQNRNNELDIRYTGPLARAQKSDLAMSTERWLGSLANISQFYPEVLDYPNVDNIVRDQASNLNLPPNYVNSKDDIKKKQKAKQAAVEAQQQAALAQEAGKAMESLGKGAKEMGGPASE